jgi:uncharacterized protein YjbI with pentapeptide repeats
MADLKAERFLQGIINEKDGASRWNQYKSDKGAIDLSKINLSNQDLKEYNFTDINLAAANLFNTDLSGTDFSRANLSYANLQRTNLANAFLTNSDMKVADLRGANAIDTNLDFCDLSHAKLSGAWLVGSSLAGANLEGADLRGANLKFANMKNASLKGTNVEEADLTNVELTNEQIASLRHYDRAIIKGSKAQTATASRKQKIKVEESYEDLFAEEDCYKILEITKESPLEEIEQAYRKKAKEYHPDRVNHLGEKLKIVAQREFERIQHAYKSLSQHKTKPAISLDLIAGDILKQKKADQLQIDDYIQMIKNNPYNDKLHYNLGLVYFQKGFVDLAMEEYKKALKINPYNVYAQHNLRVAMLLKVLAGEKT